MTPDKLSNDQDGLLPEPDTSETLRLMMRGSTDGRSRWRRLLLPSLCSVGLHLFVLPLLLAITVTFSDSIVDILTDNSNDHFAQFADEAEIDPNFDQLQEVPIEERTVATDTENQELSSQALGKQTADIRGTVMAVENNWLKLKLEDGSDRTFRFDAKTALCQDHGIGSFEFTGGVSSRQVGLWVEVRYSNKDGQNLASWVELNPGVVGPSMFKDAILSDDEHELLYLINRDRLKNKLPPLVLSLKLRAKQSGRIAGVKEGEAGPFWESSGCSLSRVGLRPKDAFNMMAPQLWGGLTLRDQRWRYVGVCSGNGKNGLVYFAYLLSDTPPKE
jgi:hypothetical protein